LTSTTTMPRHPDRRSNATSRRAEGPTRRKAVGPSPRRQGPWKHGAIPVIGLVGGIGAGKSLVAEQLTRHGAVVLDADRIGHALLDQTPARDEVVARFGPDVLIPGDPPRIDRQALGAIVFADPVRLRALEAILHPRMRATFEKAIRRTVRKGQATAIVLDAAVLFEASWNTLCDLVAFVDAPADQRHARLLAERGWTAPQIAARERAQLPLDEKRRRAGAVLTNDAGPEALNDLVARFWDHELRTFLPTPTPRAARGESGRAQGGRS
jgi:dephospho-CoA kinase